MVVMTFLKTLNLKTSANYYIVNMAVSDVLCVLLNWPLYATEGMLSSQGSFIAEPSATFVCKLGIYSRVVSYVVSILSLVLIAVDRFVAIVFPFQMTTAAAKTRTVLMLLTWILPLSGGLPYILYTKIVFVNHQTFCRFAWSSLALSIFNSTSFILFYCLPLLLIIILYYKIMKSFRKPSPGNEVKCSITVRRHRQNRNIMKIFKSVVSAFFICWTPLYAYLFLKVISPSIFVKDTCKLLVGFFYYIFPLLSTAINPVILFAFSSNFRAGLKNLCVCLFWHSLPRFGSVQPQVAILRRVAKSSQTAGKQRESNR